MAVTNITNQLPELFLNDLMERLGETAWNELEKYHKSLGITSTQFDEIAQTELFLDAWTDQIEAYIKDKGISL